MKGYSEQSGIPYGMAFHKNSYVGRTFIKPKQSQRESSVKIKLNVIEEVVKGKRIVMVDDSIVRGTTCANIIKMLKKAGAKEVHVRISSPPFLHPCYFGTDVPSNEQLIAHSHTTEQIREMIGADSLGYMEVDKLKTWSVIWHIVTHVSPVIIRWKYLEEMFRWHLNRKQVKIVGWKN